MSAVLNPINGKPLVEQQAKTVKDLRKVRRGARNATRSGNPGVKAEAEKVLADIPAMIDFVYQRAAGA